MDELPATLDETYKRALKGIDKQKRDYANRLFHCLVMSIRPLHVKELSELFSILPKTDSTPDFNIGWLPEDPEEFILSTCTTLVSIVDLNGERVVQFSHFSVREYLTSGRITNVAHVSHFHILPKSAHALLARACLSVLFRLDCSIDEIMIQNFPLAGYAAKHWIDHARYEDVALDIQDEMDWLFDRNKPYLSVWIWLHDVDDGWRGYDRSPHPTQPNQVPLYYSALCGFHDLSKRLLGTHPGDVNARGGYYRTPLHGALYKGYLSIVLLLLGRGADPEARDHNDQTALHTASSHGYADVVRSLIDCSADLNAKCHGRVDDGIHVGWTPLHAAIYEEHRDIALLLLKGGADTDILSNFGQTALYMASSRGYADVVRTLIDRDANPNVRCQDRIDSGIAVKWTPLHVSIYKEYRAITTLLLEGGADTDILSCLGQTALYMGSSCGYADVVRSLVDRGADLNMKCQDWIDGSDVKWTPLHATIYREHRDIAILLLEAGADTEILSSLDQTALYMASSRGFAEVVRLLIDRGADVDAKCDDRNDFGHVRRTPLHVASIRRRSEIAKMLLERGADVHCQDNWGWSPLHDAAQHGFNNVSRLLLDHGTNPNTPNNERKTALHVASLRGQNKAIKLLLEYGAYVDARCKKGQTPLHLAVEWAHLELVKILLEHGADVNAQRDDCWTALHRAVYFGYIRVVGVLLEHGADPHIQTNKGETAIQFANAPPSWLSKEEQAQIMRLFSESTSERM